MSYTKTYQKDIHYSGEISYPASESGGTKSYSGYVPVSIYLTVDTDPFDSSVSNVNSSVKKLTASVVAANSAQVLSIEKNASQIADHISNGFFSMIGSELSQEMARLYSQVNSSIGLLADRTKALVDLHKRMDSDYQRISKRYEEIFSTLDEELRKRIYALDKRAFEIAEGIQRKQITARETKDVSFVVTGMNDQNALKEKLALAAVHSKVNTTIGEITKTLLNEYVYAKRVRSIIHEGSPASNSRECVPVIYAKTDDINSPGEKTECFSSKKESSVPVKDFFESNAINWKDFSKEENDSITSAFNALAEKDLVEAEKNGNANAKRVYETIMALRQNSNTQINGD